MVVLISEIQALLNIKMKYLQLDLIYEIWKKITTEINLWIFNYNTITIKTDVVQADDDFNWQPFRLERLGDLICHFLHWEHVHR